MAPRLTKPTVWAACPTQRVGQATQNRFFATLRMTFYFRAEDCGDRDASCGPPRGGGFGPPGFAGLRRKSSGGHELKNRNKARRPPIKPDLSGSAAAGLGHAEGASHR